MRILFRRIMSMSLVVLLLLSMAVAPAFASEKNNKASGSVNNSNHNTQDNSDKDKHNSQNNSEQDKHLCNGNCEGETNNNHNCQNNRNGDKHNNQNNKEKDKHNCKDKDPEEPGEIQTVFNRIIAFVDSNRNAVYDDGEELVAGVKVGFNDVYNIGGAFYAEGFTNVNGRAELIMDGTIDESLFYYLELLEMPVGYEITPEGNSLFGLDSRTGWNAIEIDQNYEVVTFGSNSMVYIPLVKSNTTTIEVLTRNSVNDSIVYEGINYELYQYGINGFVRIDTQISNVNGLCWFYDISTEYDVYIKATNLQDKGLIPYEFIGADGNSGYIKLTSPRMEFLVTVYEG